MHHQNINLSRIAFVHRYGDHSDTTTFTGCATLAFFQDWHKSASTIDCEQPELISTEKFSINIDACLWECQIYILVGEYAGADASSSDLFLEQYWA